jgi:hypothetical protein
MQSPGLRKRPTAPTVINRDSPLSLGHLVTWPLYGPQAENGLGAHIGVSGFPVNTGDPILGGSVEFYQLTKFNDSAFAIPFGNAPFSVAAWCLTITTASSGGGGGLRYVISSETGAAANEFIIRYSPPSGHFEAYILGAGNSVVTSSVTLATYTAYHVLMTVNTTTQAFYVNGVSQGTVAPATTVASKAITIGNDTGTDAHNRQWNGWISDVTIWNRALSANEAWMLYDPRTRWDLYWQPTNRAYSFMSPAAAAAFKPAWARGSNQLLSGGFAS